MAFGICGFDLVPDGNANVTAGELQAQLPRRGGMFRLVACQKYIIIS